MEPTEALQVQALAKGIGPWAYQSTADMPGFELRSATDVILYPHSVGYANLGVAFCPPKDTALTLYRQGASREHHGT